MNYLASANQTSPQVSPETAEEFLMKLSSPSEVVNGKAAAVLDPFSVYPITISLIALMHSLFLYQWQRRVPRKRVVATYNAIVARKRFHKMWVALLSHPPVSSQETSFNNNNVSGERDSPSWERESRSFSPSVAMGNFDSDRSNPGHGLLQSRIVRDIAYWGKRQWRLFANGSLSGFPLLLYNSHILWSCRALEQIYNEEDSWKYARCLVALTTMAVGIELCVSHALVQAIARRQQQDPSTDSLGEIQPTFDASLDPSFLGQLRQRVQTRTIGTMTTLAAALLVIFRHEYVGIGLSILPFLTDRLLANYPTLTWFICMALLTLLARYNHPAGVVAGAVVGFCWSMFSLDFLADTYHGTWMVIVLLLLTLLSFKGESPHLVPCIEYVSWYDTDNLVALANEPMLRPRSWCFEPIASDEYETSSDDENDDNDTNYRAQDALLEFTRVRSDSDGSEMPVDPDLLEQGRRPRRTRIHSRRL